MLAPVTIALAPEAWSAVAAWVSAVATLGTAGIAVTAVVIARRQLAEARRVREEQAQPYVAVFMTSSGVDQFHDLVVRNFGATAAHDVVVTLEPPPRRSAGPDEGFEFFSEVWLPERIPTLVPGQEWRTMWDFTPARAEQELPDHHAAVVSFKDSQGQSFAFHYELDWAATRNLASVKEYRVHDGAKALRDISATLKKKAR